MPDKDKKDKEEGVELNIHLHPTFFFFPVDVGVVVVLHSVIYILPLVSLPDPLNASSWHSSIG